MWRPQPALLASYPIDPSWPRLRRAARTASASLLLIWASLLLTWALDASGAGDRILLLLAVVVPVAIFDLLWSWRRDRVDRRRTGLALSLPRPEPPGVWPVADLASSAHLRLRLAEAPPDPRWQIGQDATHVFLLAPDGANWRTLRRWRR